MGNKDLVVRVAGLSTLPRSAQREELFRAAVRQAFDLEKSPLRGEVSIVFVTRARMCAMNLQYLGHDYDTDVISFAHDLPRGVVAQEMPLGDIFISSWMAARQARELSHSVLQEALTLAVHGALHLLGYDDHDVKSRVKMFRRQDAIVKSLSS
jgi:probable rRNA maturation factor